MAKKCIFCVQSDHSTGDCPKRPCYICKKWGHIGKDCKEEFDRDACFFCHEKGHMAKNCPHKKGAYKEESEEYDESFSQDEEEGEEEKSIPSSKIEDLVDLSSLLVDLNSGVESISNEDEEEVKVGFKRERDGKVVKVEGEGKNSWQKWIRSIEGLVQRLLDVFGMNFDCVTLLLLFSYKVNHKDVYDDSELINGFLSSNYNAAASVTDFYDFILNEQVRNPSEQIERRFLKEIALAISCDKNATDFMRDFFGMNLICIVKEKVWRISNEIKANVTNRLENLIIVAKMDDDDVTNRSEESKGKFPTDRTLSELLDDEIMWGTFVN